MNAPANLHRGACPGLSAPMPTGDGLLARLTPSGATITLDAFAGLCVAALAHGNGVVEITSRGSIQIRGLSATSAPLFAADVAALGIEASDGIPVLTDPLASNNGLARDLCRALVAAPFAARLSAKVSVVIDIDGLTADIVLRAIDRAHIHVALAGDTATATPLGAVPQHRAVECVLRLFETLAAAAPHSRMREAIQRGGLAAFKSTIADCLLDLPRPSVCAAFDPIGVHTLASGGALGVGLPFGHSDSATLVRLIDAARGVGASGLRTAPGRAMLVIGLSPEAAHSMTAAARTLGFIVDAADPRRKVVACAGAPICASGEITARVLAPLLADAAQGLPPRDILHISGCAKGCAHPIPTPVLVIGRAGRCDIVIDGTLACSVSYDALPQRLAQLVQLRGRSP